MPRKTISNPLEIYQARIESGDLQPDALQAKAVASLQSLYDDLVTPERKPLLFFSKRKVSKGLYLYGGVGRGKSMVMDLFYSCLPEEMHKRRVHFHEFMIEAHDFMHRARKEQVRQKQDKKSKQAIMKFAAKIVREARILCFDEFHVTNIADAMILGRLFTALFDAGVVIVSTSNWPPDRLYEGGLQRDRFLPFIETLKERMEIIAVDGPIDYRALCLAEEGVYFQPLNRQIIEKVEHVFNHLTDYAPPHSDCIEVKGRDLVIPVVANGVARLSFSELCEQPLGAEDYLTIAKNYHTVFVENVPQMADEQRNEAKRFMILIDAFYEQGVNLVISADAKPDKLYSGGDHEFEFQRTVSRLLEMQSEAYLSASR